MIEQYILCFVCRTPVFERVTSIRAEKTAFLSVITQVLPQVFTDKDTGKQLRVFVLVKDWRTDESLTAEELPQDFCLNVAKSLIG